MHHPDEVLNVVAAYTRITVPDLLSHRKPSHLVEARRVAAVAYRLMGYSSPEIGRFLGGRDHTTILNSVQKATAENIADAEACLGMLDSKTYSVRWAACDDGIRWFIANPRTGVEIKLPVETGATMSLAMSLNGVDE